MTWTGELRAPLTDQLVYPPVEHGRLKTWVGVGGSPESVVRAAHYGLPLVLAIIGGSPARFAPLADLYRKALEQFEKPLQPIAIHSPGYIAESDEQARDTLWPYYKASIDRIGRERGWAPATREHFEGEASANGSLYVGSPESVAQKIAAAMRTLGATRFDLKYSNGTLPHDELMLSIERYAHAGRAARARAARDRRRRRCRGRRRRSEQLGRRARAPRAQHHRAEPRDVGQPREECAGEDRDEHVGRGERCELGRHAGADRETGDDDRELAARRERESGAPLAERADARAPGGVRPGDELRDDRDDRERERRQQHRDERRRVGREAEEHEEDGREQVAQRREHGARVLGDPAREGDAHEERADRRRHAHLGREHPRRAS